MLSKRPTIFHLVVLTVASFASACGSAPDGSIGGSSGIDSPTSTKGGQQAGETSTGTILTGGSSTTVSTPSPPIKFDVGGFPDAPRPDDGCDAVDFLFVIDNSGSMLFAQDNLVSSFPAFIGGIQSTLGGAESYHVGVVTTDEYSHNIPGCTAMGGLVVRTGGNESSDSTCGPYAENYNFMTEADDLDTAFACAAKVGIGGHTWERPMTAVRQAVGSTLAMPGACNEGFIRDDALLVIVVITDEADGPGDAEGTSPMQTSQGTPQDWYDAVVAAKGGLEENAVALVLTNYEGGSCPPATIDLDGANLIEFAELFGDNGFVGGICEPDFGPIFDRAVAVVSSACANFVPPG